ncbi:protein disulfide-isomerase domain protein [Dictyocaulus viviparus]|uniref:Protein disulfide-isomerase n=1 Tax=Dictyocaulus viviparus TaxID=29172 RepID=A0A0D8XZP0_DICVI|nr:protein disulfide-isomerase domain protein [Dictyocaulus viviparus]
MKWVIIFYLLLVNSGAEEASVENSSDNTEQFEIDNGIYILTDNNFDNFMKLNPTFFVMFYSPRCSFCSTFAPLFENATQHISVPLAKVDIKSEEALAKRYEIQHYPTFMLWKNNESPEKYEYDLDIDDITDWVRTRTESDYTPRRERVISLNSENFDDFVANQAICLVEFYAPWCGHCKKLAPEYEKAAKYLEAHGSGIKLAKVDATVEKSLAEKYGVDGFPTLIVMRHGRRFDYNGPRNANGIASYMIEQSQPAAKKLSNAGSIERFMEKDDVTIIGFFDDDSSNLQAYLDSAEMLRDEFKSMGYTHDSQASKKYNSKSNDIVVFYPAVFHSKYEPKTRTFNKAGATSEELVAFFRDHCTPLKNNAFRYSKYPLVVVYYNADFSLQYREGSEFWRQKVLAVAQKYVDENYRFAISDEEEFADELGNVGLGDSGLEHNVVVFGYDGKMYPMDPNEFDGELYENLEGFMKKISAGQVKPFVKSSPIPRHEKGPIRTLVALNFENVVNDESKDVLIFFYAPWCGHCKNFEPTYKSLAWQFKEKEPNLILAQFDVTANDVPQGYKVEGFPTIYFAPSGKKLTPIKYEGTRNEDAIISFLEKHAVKSFRTKDEL